MSAFNSEKGLTLVEVLAALAILGIVFVSIMTIFPQMTLFNEKTGTKLDTMNLAKEEMAEIVSAEKWRKILIKSAVTENTSLPDYLSTKKIDDEPVIPAECVAGMLKMDCEMAKLGYTLVTRSAEKAIYHRMGDYLYEADLYLNCEAFLNPSLIGEVAAPDMCGEYEPIKLYRVHLKIFEENLNAPGTYRLSSEAYSFLSYEAVEPSGP